MFGIGMPELVLIFVIALLVFGPKELPRIGRTIGKAMAEFRRASDDLKEGIQREIELAEREISTPEPPPAPVVPPAEPAPVAPAGESLPPAGTEPAPAPAPAPAAALHGAEAAATEPPVAPPATQEPDSPSPQPSAMTTTDARVPGAAVSGPSEARPVASDQSAGTTHGG